MSRVLATKAQGAFGIEGQSFDYRGPRGEGNPNSTSSRFEVKEGTTAAQIAESLNLANVNLLAESVAQGIAAAPMGVGRKTVKITVSEHEAEYDGDPLGGKQVATINTW